jgi:hypothetical protein
MLTEDELQKAMVRADLLSNKLHAYANDMQDFVTHIFVPTDPEMQEAVGTRLGMDLLAPGAPILTEEQIDRMTAGDEDAKFVLNQCRTFDNCFSLLRTAHRP